MKFSIPIEQITPADKDCVGGKAYSLSVLHKQGFRIPYALNVTTAAYNHYTQKSGLHERISLELHRKNFHEMRWEEMWDASLRIRNMFLTSKLPDDLEQNIRGPIEKIFSGKAVVVRSSAPGEDSAGASFAGLHDSFVNIKGIDAILYHIRLVWASLWSDAALLYRQELGLDVTKSTMAVLVQEIIKGEKSGVVFSQNPDDETQAVIESVYGLNQGLVDGTVEPDRWFLARESGRVVSHIPALRDKIMTPAPEGTTLVQLPKKIQALPPLNPEETARVFALAMQSEIVWGYPQDVEWTFHNDQLYTLQSRPITTIGQGRSGDERPWYLSLKRSFENLKTLRKKIEDELIPLMEGVANELARIDLSTLSDEELIGQIKEREAIFDHWEKVYWSDFIPFAHGMRLFGQVYNDTIRPEDPYEFMDLLSGA
ncbi:MAG: PEP/pyruvate-binding domain-containing protein, partial [Deltaproteobacteria bacterium]|nr:PEP/pyruvate-binding domain-containing protein [Deltaproteobacteria bacterium]